MEHKSYNPVYTTFKGGKGSWNEDNTSWDWVFFWGYLRFCYDKRELKDGWVHISLHGYKEGYTYTPVKLKWWNFHWHFAYRSKYPFLKIGFKSIENLFKN